MRTQRIAMCAPAVLLVACVAAVEPSAPTPAGKAESPTYAFAGDGVAPAPPLGPEPAGHPARWPILLAPGLLSRPGGLGCFDEGIERALGDDGHRVHLARTIPPLHPVFARAHALAQEVDALVPSGGKVHIIAHSMGGLDARYLIRELGYGDRVASLTTIATPHRGSPIADRVLDYGLSSLVTYVAGAAGFVEDEIPEPIVRAALVDLSAEAPAFVDLRDDPRVFYQSWAGISSLSGGPISDEALAQCDGFIERHSGAPLDILGWLTWGTAGFLTGRDGDLFHDGQVQVRSARYGVFRGCVPADHLQEIGQPDQMAPHWRTGFDPVRFYRYVAFELARLEACDGAIQCDGAGAWGRRCDCAPSGAAP